MNAQHWELIGSLARLGSAIWMGCVMISVLGKRFARTPMPNWMAAFVHPVRHEVGPFVPVLLALERIAWEFAPRGDDLFDANLSVAVGVVSWYVMRKADHDDDDRWKRRRKRLAAKVTEVAGRLTVVPATQGT